VIWEMWGRREKRIKRGGRIRGGNIEYEGWK
jgi:hypothetical protein